MPPPCVEGAALTLMGCVYLGFEAADEPSDLRCKHKQTMTPAMTAITRTRIEAPTATPTATPTAMPLSLDSEDDDPRSVGNGAVGTLAVGAVPAGDDVKTDPGVESGTACGASMGEDVKSATGTSVVGLGVVTAFGANVGDTVNSSMGAGVTTTAVTVVGLGVIKTVATVGESVGSRKLEGDTAGGVGTVSDGIATAPLIW
jgi:hypothetical protein